MANEIVHAADTGTVYYARVFDSTGQVWNTSGTPAFEAWVNGNVTDYDIALVDKTSGEYIGTFPACDAGRYRIKIYKRAGGAPAITDKVRGQGWILWDGTSEIFGADEDDVGGSSLVLGAGDVGDFVRKGVVHFFWNTIDRTGAAVAPSTAGTLEVYKDDGTGEVTAPTGLTDNRAFDGVTGQHECKIDTRANSFYEKEKNYSVILVAAVIDTKTVNVKIASFSIENRWANVHFHYGGK